MNRNFLKKYGPRALITGASSGIGEAFARRLAAQGFDLVLVARRRELLERLALELSSKYSVRVETIAVDLSSPGGCGAVLDYLMTRDLEISLLVNNAGYGLLGEVDSHPLEKELGMVDLNCRAVVHLTHRLMSPMKRRGGGGVITVASVVGTIPAAWFATYSATKAFDLYFGEALYCELKPYKVDALTVLPGLTKTEFQAGAGMRDYHSPYRTAENVADSALRALGWKAIVVDGWFNKLMVHGSRFLPRAITLMISRKVMYHETQRLRRAS